ncbi:MAG: hypothetical protein ABIM98_07325 [candidate division WOR-3 bacterium]
MIKNMVNSYIDESLGKEITTRCSKCILPVGQKTYEIIPLLEEFKTKETEEDLKKLRFEQQILYYFFRKAFKEDHKTAMNKIITHSPWFTTVWKYSRPMVEQKLLERFGKGLPPELKKYLGEEEKKEETWKWIAIGGGVLAGILLIAFIFRRR